MATKTLTKTRKESKAGSGAKTKDVEVMNLKVIWEAKSRTLRADFYDDEGDPSVCAHMRRFDKPPDSDSVIPFVRDAVEDYMEFLKSLNAITKK
jgi:hypothetical protein